MDGSWRIRDSDKDQRRKVADLDENWECFRNDRKAMHQPWRRQPSTFGSDSDEDQRRKTADLGETWACFRNDRKPVHQPSRRQPSTFGRQAATRAAKSLKPKFLGAVNNSADAAVFVEGMGDLERLQNLSDIFKQDKFGRPILRYNTNKSWIIAQTIFPLSLRIPKSELIWDEDNVYQIQQEGFYPTLSYRLLHDREIDSLNLNIVSSRCVLKNLMTMQRRSYQLIIRKRMDGILYVRTPVRKRDPQGIDVSTGTTFEEFLSSGKIRDCKQLKQFYGIYHLQLGNLSILYHAEIDALRSDCQVTDYSSLSTKDFVEVKTVSSATIGGRDGSSDFFLRKRLADWWAQSKLAGVEEMVCGVLSDELNPYSFNSKEIQVEKVLHLKISEFPAKARKEIPITEQVWTEESLVSQLELSLQLLKKRAQNTDIEFDRDYSLDLLRFCNNRTGEISIQIGTPSLL